ncbi:MAG: right-handed parallel beta-helix repeat-containing protein [Candidatus Rokubacteria bacterium]|nr:right-handed parallel beta-helix repeat-containing protein [Candidatus Rokubacteria bacterium]
MLTVIVMAPAHTTAREIDPDADLCGEIRAVPPGEELVLAPGDYQGPCVIRRGGEPGAPLVIRAADPARRPRIMYAGRATNVFEVRAGHVTIRGLEFGPTQQDVDAVRIFNGNGVTVEDCHFTQLGGIAVVANHSSVRGLVVRRNVIRSSTATAMYFGCHDGIGCIVSGLVVEGNFIEGINAPDPEIGYGIQVKLNSSAIIRGNTVMNTKGPGIMVYGSQHGADVNVVERNVTIGSRSSSGIVVGGGPAAVRNNIAASNEQAGIELLDYKNRGLLRTVLVANNTVYGNRAGGITAPATGLSAVTIVNNAAESSAGTRPYPARQTGVQVMGNVDCADVPCFANPDQRDFSPGSGSRLNGAGVSVKDAWMPREDFFGVRRGNPLSAGAIERPSGPLALTPGR